MNFKRLNTIREEGGNSEENHASSSQGSSQGGNAGDEKMKTCSSYQMSIELNEDTIGEGIHKMHDKLFKPIVNTQFGTLL